MDGLALAETTPGPLIMVLQSSLYGRVEQPARIRTDDKRGRGRARHHLRNVLARASYSSLLARRTSSAAREQNLTGAPPAHRAVVAWCLSSRLSWRGMISPRGLRAGRTWRRRRDERFRLHRTLPLQVGRLWVVLAGGALVSRGRYRWVKTRRRGQAPYAAGVKMKQSNLKRIVWSRSGLERLREGAIAGGRREKGL